MVESFTPGKVKMTVYQAITLMIAFATLVLALTDRNQKK